MGRSAATPLRGLAATCDRLGSAFYAAPVLSLSQCMARRRIVTAQAGHGSPTSGGRVPAAMDQRWHAHFLATHPKWAVIESLLAFAEPSRADLHLTRAAVGASLAMLGPGAFSIDAKLYGRKLIEL
jgi:hypothetical protein